MRYLVFAGAVAKVCHYPLLEILYQQHHMILLCRLLKYNSSVPCCDIETAAALFAEELDVSISLCGFRCSGILSDYKYYIRDYAINSL